MAAMKPKVRDDLAVVELDGEAVVYDDDSGQLHHLNPTATLIFGFCDGTTTIKEFGSQIAEAFQQPAADVEREIRALIKEFRRAGLLQQNGGSRGKN